MTAVRALLLVVAVIVVAAIVFVVFAWRSSIAAVAPPQASSFDSEQVKKGAQLAAAGNCITCHTAPNGKPFAGGFDMASPFGTIYSTNITPDADTGIGRWSEEAFRRALREGVDREGRHLYPAFPYDHFTKLADEDITALYAFMMTREPVRAEAPANELPFPLNIRLGIAGWKLLYLKTGQYQPDRDKSAEWNRGAYVAEALTHCGACHTPRNALGAEKRDQAFGGGEAEGWNAYALNQNSPAPVPWDVAALAEYLRTGWHEAHGMARGPMVAVIENLRPMADSDIKAIATYIADVAGEPTADRKQAGQKALDRTRKDTAAVRPASADVQTTGSARTDTARDSSPGAAIFQAACASCHEAGRPLPYGAVDLAVSTGPSGPTPRNVINVVLWGLPPAEGMRTPIMPAFNGLLSDTRLTQLLEYVRKTFSDKPAWRNVRSEIEQVRKEKARDAILISPPPSIDPTRTVASERKASP